MDYDKITQECLVEMFKRVGLEYPNKELTDQDRWWEKHTWTKEEEADFRAWMLKKLKKTKMVRVEQEINMFMLMWGWSNPKEDDDAGQK